jgi:hypothetical protein
MHKKITLSLILLSFLTASSINAMPEGTAGKIGASLIQTAHKYPFCTSFLAAATGCFTLEALSHRNISQDSLFTFFFAWTLGGFLLKKNTQTLMQNLDIPSLN